MVKLSVITQKVLGKNDVPELYIMSDDMKHAYNDFGMTTAQLWIKERKSEPPVECAHEPSYGDAAGNTMYMYWLKYVHTEPPSWLLHDKHIINASGETAELVWLKYSIIHPPPLCIREKKKISFINVDDGGVYDYTKRDMDVDKQIELVMSQHDKRMCATSAYTEYKVFCISYHIRQVLDELSFYKLMCRKYVKELVKDKVYICDKSLPSYYAAS